MGAGGFGTSLALILSRLGHQITLWDIDKQLIKRWQKLGKSDRYPYLSKHRFPDSISLVSTGKIDSSFFDFVIISSSMQGIIPTLGHLKHRTNTPLVLIQKGMLPGLISPEEIAKKKFPHTPVLQFTGAAFAKDIANGSPAGMMVIYNRSDENVAKKYANLFRGSNLWVDTCTDIRGVNIHNTLRTIASFEQGFVYGYFENKSGRKPPISSIAITFSAISQETKLIARALGATKEIHDIGSKAYRMIEADLMLCQNDTSRNFALGHMVGKGMGFNSAKNHLTQGVAECVNNIKSISSTLQKTNLHSRKDDPYPYLAASVALLKGKTIDEVMQSVIAHHQHHS